MKPSIKLVALDMDGTLLDSSKQPPKDFTGWVRNHPQIQTVLASGRQYETLRRQFPELEDSLAFIADNGSFVFRKGEMIFSDEMNREGVLAFLKAMEALPQAHLILCGANSAYMLHGPEIVESNAHIYYKKLEFVEDLRDCLTKDCIGKIAVFVDDHRAEAVYRAFPAMDDAFKAMLSGDSWVDVSNKTVGKGAAVEHLQQTLGITPDNCMAFGDYLNDCELLASCTESYAMGNAHPDLKAMARYITDTNDNDGVMKILRRL